MDDTLGATLIVILDNKEVPLSSHSVGEMDTDEPKCVLHLEVERYEDIADGERKPLTNMEGIKNENVFNVQNVKEEPLEDVDIKKHGIINNKELLKEVHVQKDGLPREAAIKEEPSLEFDVNKDGFLSLKDIKQEEVQIFTDQDVTQGLLEEVDIETGMTCEIAIKEEPSQEECGIAKFKVLTVREGESEEIENIESSVTKGPARTETCLLVESRPFECNICHLRFSYKHTLKRHFKNHTGEKPFECEMCQRKFQRKCYFIIHIRIHTGEKPFECEISHCKFRCKFHLPDHLRTHTGEKPFECKICQHKCTSKPAFRKHLRMHTPEKPYGCEICYQRYGDESALSRHLRRHTVQKQFECEVCQRKFGRKLYLTDHLRKHTGEKPYECKICQHKFATKRGLVTHVKTHGEKTPFICQICRKVFDTESALNEHLNAHDIVKSFDWHQRYVDKSALSIHLQTYTGKKPFECEICRHKFGTKCGLGIYVKTHGEKKPFMSDIQKMI